MNYPDELLQKMHASSMQTSGLIGGVGAMSQAESMKQVRPSTEIEGCLSRTNDALARMHNRVDALTDRLRPVMRAAGSGTQAGTAVPKEALSPLGDALRSVEDGIDGACNRLEALLNGLAL